MNFRHGLSTCYVAGIVLSMRGTAGNEQVPTIPALRQLILYWGEVGRRATDTKEYYARWKEVIKRKLKEEMGKRTVSRSP